MIQREYTHRFGIWNCFSTFSSSHTFSSE